MVDVEQGWHTAENLPAENKQGELDSVLSSSLFSRSEQLRSFLRYVCSMEMSGRASELNEYLVGVEALGRPESYSPVDDSTVRSRAWELRQKLLKLYSEERKDSELRIDLPRGGYSPRYLVREPKVDIGLPPLLPSMAIPIEIAGKTKKNQFLPTVLASGLIGALVASAVLIFTFRRNNADPIDPVLRQAWGPALSPQADDLLVASNGFYLLIRPDLPSTANKKLQFPVPAELYEAYREKRPLEQGRKLTMFPSNNTIQMGYVNGLVKAATLLQSAKATYSIVPERIIGPPALRKRNVLFFGTPQDSAVIKEMMAGASFQIGYDPQSDLMIRKNGAGGYHLTSHGDSNSATTYGLITVMPSLGSEPGDKQTVIFSGITSVGAQAAAEFFSSAKSMKTAIDHLNKVNGMKLPLSYQILVRCEASDTLLISFEYVDSAINHPKLQIN